jgi:hypothetical protein
MVQDYKYPTQRRLLFIKIQKKQAIVAIANAMENVIQQSPNSGEVIPLTCDNGIQFKVFTMHSFSNDNKSPDKEVGGNGGPISLLLNLTIMPNTKQQIVPTIISLWTSLTDVLPGSGDGLR